MLKLKFHFPCDEEGVLECKREMHLFLDLPAFENRNGAGARLVEYGTIVGVDAP